MISSDFLSRQNHDNSNPHEIIPISFNLHSILHDKYYNIGKSEKYLVQTWSQAKSSGIKLQEVHSVSTRFRSKYTTGKTGHKPLVFKVNEISQKKSHISQQLFNQQNTHRKFLRYQK